MQLPTKAELLSSLEFSHYAGAIEDVLAIGGQLEVSWVCSAIRTDEYWVFVCDRRGVSGPPVVCENLQQAMVVHMANISPK